MCEICHKRVFFHVSQGKVDNLDYLAYHNRQALPVYHPNFLREYPQLNGKI